MCALLQPIAPLLHNPIAGQEEYGYLNTSLTVCNRLVAVGLVPLTLAPFAAGSLNPVMDSILCALLVVHSHIGFEYVLSAFLIRLVLGPHAEDDQRKHMRY